MVAVLGIIGALVYYTNTSNLFGTQAATTIVGTTATTSLSSLNDGLVGHWTFNGDTISGTTVSDVSGNGNNGTLSNGPVPMTGQVGQGMKFDGVDDYISSPHSSSYNFAYNQNFSIGLWVKIPANQTDVTSISNIILQKWPNTGGYPYAIRVINQTHGTTADRGKLIFARYDGTNNPSIKSRYPLNDNAWHRVDFLKRGSILELYVDGILESTVTDTTIGNTTNSDPLYFGVETANTYRLNGSLDDVRIYNRALSADEVYRLYQLGKGTKIATTLTNSDAVDNSLVGHWRLDEGSGTTALDSSGNGNTGTLTNSPTWTTGRLGGGVSFDGSSKYITMGSSAVLSPASELTLGVWVYPTSNNTYDPILVRWNGPADKRSYALDIYNGTLRFHLANDCLVGSIVTLTDVSTITLNTWTYVSATFDGTTMKLYRNGDPVASAGSAGICVSNATTELGGDTISPGYFRGSLDEARIYDRALSQKEIVDLYRKTVPTGLENGLVGHWTFDGPDISGTTAYDRSGIGSNATLVNGAKVTPGKLGQDIYLDGTNDYLSVANHSAQHFGTGDFTYSFWVNFDQTQTGVLFSNGTYVDGIMFYRYDNGTTYLWIANANGQSSAWNPPTNTWQHVVLRRESGTVYMYADGVQKFTLGLPGNVTDVSASGMRIGYGFAGSANVVLDGKIDDFRMYNRALSVEEIQDLYHKGQGVNMDGFACGKAQVHDVDYNYYDTIQIGTQCWMKQNMRVGTRISGATNQTNNSTIEKWCYSNTDSNCTSNDPNVPDGGLYQWNEAMQYSTTPGAQGICPSGWHIPTHDEFTTLERSLCTSGTCSTDFPYDTTTTGYRGTTEGTKLQPGGTSGLNFNLAGNGFSGSFFNRGSFGNFWSSSESGAVAWYRVVDSASAQVYRTTNFKSYGFSVRCLKDS